MKQPLVGICFHDLRPPALLAAIVRADALGVPACWLTAGSTGSDSLTLIAAAAARTSSVRLGTSIVPTFPRHPLVMATQAEVIASLAPGRFVLGIGPSHRSTISGIFGLPFERPLEHLREYVTVLKAGLHTGRMEFEGARIRVHAELPNPSPVPVMISALGAPSFRLAGSVADGAISWVCPAAYLRDVAIPAMTKGAAEVQRSVPPLIAHDYIALSRDGDAVARAARQRLAHYPRQPFYARMFDAAGYPEATRGELTDAMIDAVVLHGEEAEVAERLRKYVEISGASEMVASVMPVGPEPGLQLERAIRFVAGL